MSGVLPEPTPSRAARQTSIVAAAFLLCATLSIQLYQLSLIRTRTFDPDEFQHAHSAYLISKGELPYRDYFEHHPPFLHLLAAPVLGVLRPDGSGEEAYEALFVLRTIGWAVAFVGGLLHFLIARRILGTLGGSLASLLLWSTLVVFETTMEIRPDTAAFALLQCALLLLSGTRTLRRTAYAFLLLGIGLLFTQKLALPVLGIIAFVALSGRSSLTSKSREVALSLLLLLVPTALCGLYFAARGGGPQFIEDVFLINLRWKARLAPWPFFVSEVATRNPFLVALGGAGLVWGLLSVRRSRASGGLRLMLFAAVGGFVGLYLLPVAWAQYYLLVVPQIAILGAGALAAGLTLLFRRVVATPAFPVIVILAAALGLAPSADQVLNQRLRTNDEKRKAIAVIHDNSTPGEPVLDGYAGIGVFRPHAFRYFFLHAEMRQMLSEGDVEELERGLESGAIAPRFASGDSQLSATSPAVKAFLEANFAPIGIDPVLVRLFPGGTDGWNDATERFPGMRLPRAGPYVLTIDGWATRPFSSETAFRRSAGKRSILMMPVLSPDTIAALELSARAAADVSGMTAVVRVNGRELGEISLAKAFSKFRLSLPDGVLIRGLNRIEFAYPQRPAQITGASTVGGNEVLDLESVAPIKKEPSRAPRTNGF